MSMEEFVEELDGLVLEIRKRVQSIDSRNFQDGLNHVVAASVRIEEDINDYLIKEKSSNRSVEDLAVGVMWKASELREIALTFPDIEMPAKSIAHNPNPSKEKREEIHKLYENLKDSGDRVESELCLQIHILEVAKNRTQQLRNEKSGIKASQEKSGWTNNPAD